MVQMAQRSQLIREEGYKCGHCAAYPCFRMKEPGILEFYKERHPQNYEKLKKQMELVKKEASQQAGLCFQPTRRCGQECDNYLGKTIDGQTVPANGGTCKADGTSVAYEQNCHIPEMRSKISK